MNSDHDYGFDVAGFIRLPQVLTAEEMQACTQAIDAVGRDEGMLEWPAPWGEAFRRLHEHPALQDILAALCGPDFVLDLPAVASRCPRRRNGQGTVVGGRSRTQPPAALCQLYPGTYQPRRACGVGAGALDAGGRGFGTGASQP